MQAALDFKPHQMSKKRLQ